MFHRQTQRRISSDADLYPNKKSVFDEVDKLHSSREKGANNSSDSFNFHRNSPDTRPSPIPRLIPEDILESLLTRFLTEEEREEKSRLMFAIEQAHWHYLDYYCNKPQAVGKAQTPKYLPKLSLRKFTMQLLTKYPWILEESDPNMFKESETLSINHQNQKISEAVEQMITAFQDYKRQVPTYGAILIDKTYRYCLLVRGANSRVSWGFPKGKMNQNEPPENCAVREVMEEVGFDCSKLIDSNTAFLEAHVGKEQSTRLYLVCKVDMEQAKFLPNTRNEIRDIKWFLIDELPDEKKSDDNRVCEEENLNAGNFFMAIAFITPLRNYCRNKRDELKMMTIVNNRKMRNNNRMRSDWGKNDKRNMKNNANWADPYIEDFPTCREVANCREMQDMLAMNNSPKVLSRNIVRKEQPIALNQLKEICKGRKEKIEMKETVENNEKSETSKSSEKIVVTIDDKFDGNLLNMLQAGPKTKEKAVIFKKCQAWENVDWDKIVNLK